MKVIDLCGGPGGWDIAAEALGLDVLGIEWDDAACLTRKAAGLATIQGDIREYRHLIRIMNLVGLIASPPCQTFSAAGKGAGRKALADVLAAIEVLVTVGGIDHLDFGDERTGLVLEPLRWALDAHDLDRPFQWIAWEQVPAVLPIWEACAEVLRELGYSVATGILNAEQFGVPQTRRRAVLIARLDGEAALPVPTHSRFHVRQPEKLDAGVLPWVSMSEALGWADEELIGFPRLADTPSNKADQSIGIDGVRYRARDLRPAGRPAQVVTEKTRSWKRFLQGNQYPNGRENGYQRRPIEHPAQTVTGMTDRYRWVGYPSPVIAAEARGRLMPRGCKHPGPGCCSAYPGAPGRQFSPNMLRVTVEEAAALQTFPDDYPWHGAMTKKHQQIGNAIPPLLALKVLESAIGLDTLL